MEEADALEALSNTLTLLTEDPYDITLHAQHVRLARASGMEDQLESALEMVTSFWAAGDYVWLSLLEIKSKVLDLDKAEDVHALLALFERAEEDYLCMSYSSQIAMVTRLTSAISYPIIEEACWVFGRTT